MSLNIDIQCLRELLQNEHQCYAGKSIKNVGNDWLKNFYKFADNIICVSENFDQALKMTHSVGQGKWTFYPWLRIYYPALSSGNTSGIFMGIQFGWEEHSVIFSILQGVDGADKQLLSNNKKLVQTNIASKNFVQTTDLSSFTPPFYSDNKTKMAKAIQWAQGMVFHKQYTLNTFPSAEQLQADYGALCSLYKEIDNTFSQQDGKLFKK